MHWQAVLFATVALCCGFAAAGGDSDDVYDESRIHVLTNDSFDAQTAKGDWLLDFYAPWCGHCKKLMPSFARAAVELEGKLQFGKIDATVHKALAKRFNVKGFPSLIFYRDGVARPYKSGRTQDAMVKFGRQVTEPPVKFVDVQGFAREQSLFPVSFLLVTDAANSTEAWNTYTSLARSYQGQFLFAAADASAAKEIETLATQAVPTAVGTWPRVLCFAVGAPVDATAIGALSKEQLREFIVSHRFPPVSELTALTFDEITSPTSLASSVATRPQLAVYLVDSSSSPETATAFLQTAVLFYRNREGPADFVFARVDGVKYASYVGQFGIRSDSLPALAVLDSSRDLYFRPNSTLLPDGTSDAQLYSAFIQSVLDGTAQSTNLHPWYSPTRFTKAVEKFLDQFSETTILAVAVTGLLVVVALMACVCFMSDEPSPERLRQLKEQRLAAAGISKNAVAAAKAGEERTQSVQDFLAEGAPRQRKPKA